MQQLGALKRTDPTTVRLLRSLAYGDVSTIKPRIGQDVRYPLVEEIAHTGKEKSKEMLQRLHEQGYLERRFEARIYRCPHDNTASIRPRLSCPRCNSEALERHQLLEHISCGHVDLERNFIEGSRYVCPKDHKPLRQIGVDYRKAGTAYRCSSCGELTPFPTERWVCNASGHIFSLEEAVSEDVYSYQLAEERYDEIRQALEFVDPLAETLRKNGYVAETFANVVGASGITHSVDIYARSGDPERGDAIMISVLAGEAARPENVLGTYGVVLDTSPKLAVLVAIPYLSEESKFYAQRLGMMVIEGSDVEKASQQLALVMRDRGSERMPGSAPATRASAGSDSGRSISGPGGEEASNLTTDFPSS